MTKIWAHRGASLERPENSLAAFKRAIELKADGIELDVYLLSDGSVVVHHDTKLGRCESPENSIMDYTAKDIKSFSIGAKFSKEYKGETVPFLWEVLELLKDTDLHLNVEIKYADGFITPVGDKVVELLAKYGMKERSVISSFHHYILRDIKEKHSDYKVAALFTDLPNGLDIVKYCKENKFDAINPGFWHLHKETVDKCKQNGIAVNVWTPDAKADLKKMVEYGVDTLITNNVPNAFIVLGR